MLPAYGVIQTGRFIELLKDAGDGIIAFPVIGEFLLIRYGLAMLLSLDADRLGHDDFLSQSLYR